MQYKELRWDNLGDVLAQLKSSQFGAIEAAKRSAIPPVVWHHVRRCWDKLPEHLAKVDPHGAPVDLEQLNSIIQHGVTFDGVPVGLGDRRPK